jgi:NAD(P)-dependent dehydrogenase (short-subunit alcohol dehydrogenase family)
MAREGWTARDIPDQTGKLAIITGANSGIGYESARALAARRAAVILAVRSPERGERAAEAIRAETPDADLDVAELDLASLASVQRFAERIASARPMVDLLINNAGVMATPYGTTEDGFERQIGINHFGHFALTGRLLGQLLAAPSARVVTVSSGAHRMGRIALDDLHSERGYRPFGAYSRSKLANLLFTSELQRRFDAIGAAAIAVAAHPGTAATGLQASLNPVAGLFVRWLGHGQDRGALPTLYAATAPDVQGNDYLGPNGFLEQRGTPTKVSRSAAARDQSAAQRLWELSVEATGVDYAALKQPA